jgi:transaldolase
MIENPLARLNRMGQSVWFDNIRRGLLTNGEMERMARAGEIRGVTSNPAIFEQAITQTNEYDTVLKSLALKHIGAEAAYEVLALEDIRTAADIFKPIYDESRGLDGFISLEVSPILAQDPYGTVKDAVRLSKAVGRPNLMIKIPGTEVCLEAIRKAIADGIPINITLLFSVERYKKVMEAYASGLEDRMARGLPLDTVNSVASFFVSRLDTNIDKQLDQLIRGEDTRGIKAKSLRGKAAIVNTRLAYQEFLAFVRSERWKRLAAKGANLQRPLWASTSTKDPAYPDTYYVEALVAPDSVNTMPPATIDAYREHGNPAIRIENDLEESRSVERELADLGIFLSEITSQLEREGIAAFQSSYQTILEAIQRRLKS